jgi:hypothetical protein
MRGCPNFHDINRDFVVMIMCDTTIQLTQRLQMLDKRYIGTRELGNALCLKSEMTLSFY